VAAVLDLVSGWRRAVLSEPFPEAAARPTRREAAGFPRPADVLIRKNPVAVTHKGSAPLGHAIPLLCLLKTALGTSSRHAGSGRIEPPEIEPGRTAAKCRTPRTVFPDEVGSVNVIATDLPARSEPADIGTLLVTNRSGPGVRNQADADPGRDCRIASGPRSRTSRRFSQRVSERTGAAEFPTATARRIEQPIAHVVGMRCGEARTGRRCSNPRPFADWAFSWHPHNFRAPPGTVGARAREPLLAPAGCRR
jgi:hypothetical protein